MASEQKNKPKSDARKAETGASGHRKCEIRIALFDPEVKLHFTGCLDPEGSWINVFFRV